MKIVIATAVYYPMINGVAVFSYNLAKGLAARGHEVLVLCPSQKGRAYSEMQDGVKVCYLRSREFKLYPDQIHVAEKKTVVKLPYGYEYGFRIAMPAGRAVARILRRFRPEIVHVQVADLIGVAAARWADKNEVPLIMTEHNQPEVLVEPLGLPRFLRKPAEAVLSTLFMTRLNYGDFATMPTQEAIKNLIWARGKGFKVPVAAVSNGVELSHFKPGRVKREIYEKYGLKKGVPTVLYVGRVDPEKKVGLILEAFWLAREKVKDAQLVVVGDGVARKDLEERAKEGASQEELDRERTADKVAQEGLEEGRIGDEPAQEGLEDEAVKKKLAEKAAGEARKVTESIHFLGRVVPPDLYELYRAGTVFATASEIETQGIVLIEAAATGLPLVAVDKGAVSEVCRNGENGILCRPGEVEEIAVAMVKILSDKKLREKFSKNSLKIARENDFERTLDQFLNVYQKAIELKN